jgi:hypothetical protein
LPVIDRSDPRMLDMDDCLPPAKRYRANAR